MEVRNEAPRVPRPAQRDRLSPAVTRIVAPHLDGVEEGVPGLETAAVIDGDEQPTADRPREGHDPVRRREHRAPRRRADVDAAMARTERCRRGIERLEDRPRTGQTHVPAAWAAGDTDTVTDQKTDDDEERRRSRRMRRR